MWYVINDINSSMHMVRVPDQFVLFSVRHCSLRRNIDQGWATGDPHTFFHLARDAFSNYFIKF
jgi:hypothetical protein